MSDYDDSSSVLSSSNQLAVKQRFDSACILCGYPGPVDVAHIIPTRDRDRHLRLLRTWSIQLAGFGLYEDEDLVCFCPNHHSEYNNGFFTIVPSPNVRQQMREQEIKDFEFRPQVVNSGFSDPGRRLLMPPELPYEFEYIPLTVPLYSQFHNETPSLAETFVFSSQEMEKYPLRRWEISVYPVLLAAYQPLYHPLRIRSARSDAALSEVVELVDMYRRRITPTPSLPKPFSDQKITQIQADLTTAQTMYPACDSMMQALESPDEAVGQGSFTNNPTGRINDLWRDEDTMGTMNTGTGDFPDSNDDPVVTPEVLSNRLQWRHTGFSSMRFATSSDFIVDPGEPQA